MPAPTLLADFHPLVRAWFIRTHGEPTPPQTLGWPSISAGNNTLILAPTGSGKTLAAFLWAINHLVEQHIRETLVPGVRIVYVSPLKALNNDIERNLEAPLSGIRNEADAAGVSIPVIRAAVRTGDTPASRRTAMQKHPPDILITTPESLYLMLTSRKSRPMFRTVQYVIVDEIHSLCGNKRGVHLSLTLERLQEVADQEFTRIGLSATQRPLERIAAFLGGQGPEKGSMTARPVTIIDAGRKKETDLCVVCASPDMSSATQESIWPMIFTGLLDLIRRHTTTLLFVNNRRLAERVAAQLNLLMTGELRETPAPVETKGLAEFNLRVVPQRTDWDDVPLVQAYHGSMSRQAREQMEADLKEGKLRALVATSSLELGIDIGSIDLVIQLQSPRGIARGLQRIGRSGHLITATSKGRIFPTHREDLVESAVVARSMLDHDVEETEIPENCLDVLAQQIVAMVSVGDREVDALFDRVRQSYCYRSLSRTIFDGVLRMLSGRYTNEAFRELRARVSWDKVNGVLRSLPGSGQLAVTSGGTIADRGYFGVYLADGKTKVGEVDEEFVYETRQDDTFILGTSVWRVDRMDANRLTVSPAPGQPARMPFWRGEGIGRSYALGAKVGEFRRTMEAQISGTGSLNYLKEHFPIDNNAAWNIQEYFRRQYESTGMIPNDRLLVIEGFRDEIGDPRLVVHSPFGRRVNGLMGLVLARRLHHLTGVTPQMLYNDDGILLRCSDAESLPLTLFDGLTTADAQTAAMDEVLSSPLFAGQFRQNAARALLMPRAVSGRRTPLWLQRLRAGDLLQIARRYDDFPIVVETVREVLNDVLDFRHFIELMRSIELGLVRVASVQTESPSPFAASVLFDFIAVYMYEWDQPKEDKLSQYLAVNREILAEVVNLDTFPSLIRPDAIAQVEAQLQRTADGTRARTPEELMELLLRIGDLSEDEVALRCEGDSRAFVRVLAADGRAIKVELPGGSRWIAGEEDALYNSLDDASSLLTILSRYMRSHGPVTAVELTSRYGVAPEETAKILQRLEAQREIVRGRFRMRATGDDATQEWCYRPAMEQMHRRTITVLRKEITPSTQSEFTRFLLHWQGVTRTGDDLSSCLTRLQAFPLQAEIWERDVLRARVPGITADQLSRFTSAGNGLWVGRPSGRMMFLFRGNGSLFLPPEPESTTDILREPARRILGYLQKNGASFFSDIRDGTRLSLAGMNKGLAQLFWSGVLTNDVFAELTSVSRPTHVDDNELIERVELVNPRRAPDRARIMHSVRKALRQVPGWTGRWSLTRIPGVMGPPVGGEEIAAAQAQQLLERYGIMAREFHRREELLPWPLIAAQLQRMELRGEIRRGYFVEGFSGMQYALPDAVETLRSLRSAGRGEPALVLMNACDPANPYGAGVTMPGIHTGAEPERISRLPGTYIAFAGGTPVLIIESYGARLRTLGSTGQEAVQDALGRFVQLLRLPAPLRPFKEIVIEYCDDLRPAQSPLAGALRSLGFVGDRNQTMRRDMYE